MLEGYVGEGIREGRPRPRHRSARTRLRLGIPHPKHPDRISRYLAPGPSIAVFHDLKDGSIGSGHKTAKAVKTGHLTLNDQAGGCRLAATTVLRHRSSFGPRESLAGIRYNFLRKAVARRAGD